MASAVRGSRPWPRLGLQLQFAALLLGTLSPQGCGWATRMLGLLLGAQPHPVCSRRDWSRFILSGQRTSCWCPPWMEVSTH
ncbi:ERN2 isoform 4 [Pan troglodytes]|uniref:Endoplasmic reticulum to nucleus signaling 2 n=2 Tax=Homininae TaxID=207598 RepID=H3BUU2_HUMAN|nr:endoplasmic reticulum to nucleus signaling 2 [Homo sapiens]KAI4054109.1 endoplasmic reticulum to nucleus signaling 2 [Homo sapiens]PNI23149.1 ERN2 isoform 4 [Pan troglodytes]